MFALCVNRTCRGNRYGDTLELDKRCLRIFLSYSKVFCRTYFRINIVLAQIRAQMKVNLFAYSACKMWNERGVCIYVHELFNCKREQL